MVYVTLDDFNPSKEELQRIRDFLDRFDYDKLVHPSLSQDHFIAELKLRREFLHNYLALEDRFESSLNNILNELGSLTLHTIPQIPEHRRKSEEQGYALSHDIETELELLVGNPNLKPFGMGLDMTSDKEWIEKIKHDNKRENVLVSWGVPEKGYLTKWVAVTGYDMRFQDLTEFEKNAQPLFRYIISMEGIHQRKPVEIVYPSIL